MMTCDVCGLSWESCDEMDAELLTRQCAGRAAREEDRFARLEPMRRARAAGEVDGYERGERETIARVVAWLRAQSETWPDAEVKWPEAMRWTAEAVLRGDWRNDDGRGARALDVTSR